MRQRTSAVQPGLMQDAARQTGEPAVPTPAPQEVELLRSAVPFGERTDVEIALSLDGAIERALFSNLALLTDNTQLERSKGRIRSARSAFLPELYLDVSKTRDEFNLDASFFRDFPPPGSGGSRGQGVIGPFDVFDARLDLTVPIYDPSARQDWQAEQLEFQADRSVYDERRVLVILATSNLYLRVITEQGRVEAAQAQLETARSLAELARDQKQSGLVPELEVLRSEVQLQAALQRTVSSRNGLEKARLALARAVGLPIGQRFRLSDRLTYEPMTEIDVDEAVALAVRDRPDLKRSESLLAAAQHRLRADRRARWPRLLVNAEFGYIGENVGDSKSTFGLGAFLRLPLFDVTMQADVLASHAELELQRSMLEEHRARIYYQVAAALLDAQARDQQVQVAERAQGLAARQLDQAKSRFAAGISNNLEVIRAQEDIARTSDWYLDSLLQYRNARGVLARAIGISERQLLLYLEGASNRNP